jgi:hypothetical protein
MPRGFHRRYVGCHTYGKKCRITFAWRGETHVSTIRHLRIVSRNNTLFRAVAGGGRAWRGRKRRRAARRTPPAATVTAAAILLRREPTGGALDPVLTNSDPAAMLRGIARKVKSGGIVVFHEVDWATLSSSPPAPLYEQCCRWIVDSFEKVGTNAYMGKRMYHAFQEAGMPPPTMSMSALFGGGPDERTGAGMVADLVVTMAPVMEEHGIVTRAAMDPSTLTKRVISEVVELGSVLTGRSEVGAWSRVTRGS